jgi:hypothetical protein
VEMETKKIAPVSLAYSAKSRGAMTEVAKCAGEYLLYGKVRQCQERGQCLRYTVPATTAYKQAWLKPIIEINVSGPYCRSRLAK